MILTNIRAGLEILEKYARDDTQVTESGNWLWVWNYHGFDIRVSDDDKAALTDAGWVHDIVDGWGHALSG